MLANERSGVRVLSKWLSFVLAVGLLASASCSRSSGVCASLTTIASDEQKMRYAKEWIVSHLADRDFRESLRIRKSFRQDDERVQRFGGLDWKYLGFPERYYVELDFNMPTANAAEWDITQVGSASLRWGRSFILIKLSSAKDMGLPWSAEDFARLKTVGDGVFVHCGDGG
jgi:hypothetical protein